MHETFFVSVHLDQALSKPLDYKVPQNLANFIAIGMRVEVPLRLKTAQATVVEVKTHSNVPNPKEICKIIQSTPQLSENQWKLAHWMSRYYVTPLQKVLRCFIPMHAKQQTKEKSYVFLKLAKSHEEALLAIEKLKDKQPSQAQVLQALLGHPRGVFLTDLLEKNICQSSIQTLIKKNWIQKEHKILSEDLLLEEDFFPTKEKNLNTEQKACLEEICKDIEKSTFASHLIFGVTGSGKTEIYLQAIRKTLQTGKSAMMLVPEVALTSQTIERFRSRFSEKIAILHHRRSQGEKNQAWLDLREGKTQILIGARSAIFAPIQNLGLIIVDEEHDSSYKQGDDMPCYQGRDVAVMRGYFENCPVLLGSATPSIESYYNAQTGKYKLHILKTRATNASLPKISIVNMKTVWERNSGFTHFCPQLLQAIKTKMEKGEQTLLLLNRRGYHRMQVCKACLSYLKCPHCDISLTFHKQENHLKCHICDYTIPPATNCPSCNAEQSLEYKGFGTEHVERSLHAVLPGVRTLRMDKDTTTKKNSHEELFQQFRAHKADVLIGTQMIAKGFHFQSVSLVGILYLDASLMIPDFRSPENVFQLLMQTSGRAGRADIPGEVYLQTNMPDHPIIQLAQAQDYHAFYQEQILERQMFGYPPFCHLVKICVSAADADKAQKLAEDTKTYLQKNLPKNAQIFPVTTAGHPKMKDQYRFQILIKIDKILSIADILKKIDHKSIKIDIDPSSTFF